MTESLGTIKFGPGHGLAVCAAVEVTYRDEKPIGKLVWDLADAEEVCFDAVQAEDNTWIATLVWIGRKPPKPLVGHNEDLFTRTTSVEWGRPETINECRHGDIRQFWRIESTPNRGPGIPTYQTFQSYLVKFRVIVEVMEYIRTCEVHKLAVSRKAKFTSEGFYRDGAMFSG